MDPNATLTRLFHGLMSQDWEETAYAALDLETWIERGGALPDTFVRLWMDRHESINTLRAIRFRCNQLGEFGTDDV
jgi:hypothetical protein